MHTYIYTIDRTPFSTAEREINGKPTFRQPATGKVRRFIRRHHIVEVKP